VVEDDFDELQQIKLNLFKARFSAEHMAITIAPTMACNFGCTYCFEQNLDCSRNTIMTDEVINKIFEFVEEKSSQLKKLSVYWFGGEPLIAIKQIEKISKYFLELCAKKDIKYHSSMSSNGYFLNKDIATRLNACAVEWVQVSIDGPRDIHNKRRPLINGGETFDIILQNVKEVSELLPINIRINVDHENLTNIDDVVNLFKETSAHVHVAHVQDFNSTYNPTTCLSNEQYSKFQLQFMINNNISLTSIYPKPKACYCQADHYNSWCVDPAGSLYKCHSDMGNSELAIGSLFEDTSEHIINTPLLHSYVLYDPAEDPVCSICKYLPICMGGCPYLRLQNYKDCISFKYNLDEYLLETAKTLLKEQA